MTSGVGVAVGSGVGVPSGISVGSGLGSETTGVDVGIAGGLAEFGALISTLAGRGPSSAGNVKTCNVPPLTANLAPVADTAPRNTTRLTAAASEIRHTEIDVL